MRRGQFDEQQDRRRRRRGHRCEVGEVPWAERSPLGESSCTYAYIAHRIITFTFVWVIDRGALGIGVLWTPRVRSSSPGGPLIAEGGLDIDKTRTFDLGSSLT